MPVEQISVKKKRSTIEDDQGGTGAFWDIIEKQDGIWVELKTLPEGTWFLRNNRQSGDIIYIKGDVFKRKFVTCPCNSCDIHTTVLNSVKYWAKWFSLTASRYGRRVHSTSPIEGDKLVYIPKTFPSKFFAK